MRRLRLGIVLLAVAMSGCPSPASPPGPPVELPTSLTFPESVAVDVSAIASGGSPSGAGPATLKYQVGSGGQFSDVIVLGADTAQTFQGGILEGLLFPFTHFEIPVGAAVSKFAGEIPPDGPGVLPSLFKFDFGDFDFDGDGETEGCTGCTCPADCAPAIKTCPPEIPIEDLRPVCFRVWIKKDPVEPFARVMAGVFDALPLRDDPDTPENEKNPGKGRFRAGLVDSGSADGHTGTFRFIAGVVYDHRVPGRPSDLSTEAFLINDLVQDGELVFSNNIHVDVVQEGKTDTSGKDYAEKTVKSAERLTGTGDSGIPNDFFQQYVGRFRDDADFWSGSALTRDQGIVTRNVKDACARISTGGGSTAANCLDLGIGTSGEAFVEPALDADAVFPSDFPELPGF